MDIAGYADLALLSRGGFSAVYRAHQVAMDRPAALKVLDLALTDAQDRERFRRECAAAGRLGAHPSIVTVYGCGFCDDGRPFLSMQLCEGGSLAQRLRSSGPLPVEQVLRIGVRIAGALAFAHDAGVLHRDVKPGNILLTAFGEPVLTDFGIAALDGCPLSTRTSSSFTVAHAAPECLAGHASTPAADIYSLTSTLFTLLAGRPPFEVPAANPVALAVTVIDSPVPRLARGDVPDGLAALLRTGMAKNPDRRPIDAGVFGRELQRIQAECGLPVTELVTSPGRPDDAEPTPTAPPVAGPAAAPMAEALGPVAGPAAAVPTAELLGPAPAEPETAVPGPLLVAAGSRPPPRRTRGWSIAAALVLLVLAGAALFVYRFAASGTQAAGGALPRAAAAEPGASRPAGSPPRTAADPTATPPTINSLSPAGRGAPTAVCPAADAVVMIELTWHASNASTAWLGVDAGPDASVDPLRSALPPTVGPDVPGRTAEPVPFDCSASRHSYTLTVLGPGGKVSRSIVVTARRAPATPSSGPGRTERAPVVIWSEREPAGGAARPDSTDVTGTRPTGTTIRTAHPSAGTPATSTPGPATSPRVTDGPSTTSPPASPAPSTGSTPPPATSSSSTTDAGSGGTTSTAPPTTSETAPPPSTTADTTSAPGTGDDTTPPDDDGSPTTSDTSDAADAGAAVTTSSGIGTSAGATAPSGARTSAAVV